MPKKTWIPVVKGLDLLEGQDKATLLRLCAEIANGSVGSRAYIDIPIGSGQPAPELPAGMLAVPVMAIRVGIPPETWQEILFAPFRVGGQLVKVSHGEVMVGGQLTGYRACLQAPFYRIELLRSDVEALVNTGSRGGRPQTEARERLVNWLLTLSPAEYQPKHGRPGILWRSYLKLCREDNRDPGLSESYGEQLIRDFLEDPTRFADSSQSKAVDYAGGQPPKP